MKLLRHPAAHFLALGAVLFAAAQLTDDGRALGFGHDPIEVSSARIQQLSNEWARETRRPPSRTELDALIRRFADEEILLREALRLGLDREDKVVFQRLVRNVRFLDGDSFDGARADDVATFERALALGLNERDLVVRRRLREALQERIGRQVTVDVDDVRAHVAAHPERYAMPERLSFRQVFLSADRRGEALEADVAKVAVALADGIDHTGDAFMEGARFQLQREEDLVRSFGRDFATQAMAVPLNQWSQPIRSAWGVHFIRVLERRASQAAEFETVRSRAHYALLAEREEEAVARELKRLRPLYPLKVDKPQLLLARQP